MLAASLVATGSQAGELIVVALAYLQRHGVPCQSVARIEKPIRDFDIVATCEDGRQWALFFVEGEVAFVQSETGEPYKWRREVYLAYPQVYELPREPNDNAGRERINHARPNAFATNRDQGP